MQSNTNTAWLGYPLGGALPAPQAAHELPALDSAAVAETAALFPGAIYQRGRFRLIETRHIDQSTRYAVQFDSDCDCRVSIDVGSYGAGVLLIITLENKAIAGIGVDVLRGNATAGAA